MSTAGAGSAAASRGFLRGRQRGPCGLPEYGGPSGRGTCSPRVCSAHGACVRARFLARSSSQLGTIPPRCSTPHVVLADDAKDLATVDTLSLGRTIRAYFCGQPRFYGRVPVTGENTLTLRKRACFTAF